MKRSFLWIAIAALDSILSCCEALNTKNVPTPPSLARATRPMGTYNVRSARPYRPYLDDNGPDDEFAKERSTERPTQTRTEAIWPAVAPPKPKIVVLGASGLIGRLVVRQLLDMSHLDVTIVAFVRDYDKACRVLYDDLLVASSQKRGPKLQIVQGDLVPLEDLPGYNGFEEEEQAWLKSKESADASFEKNVKDDFDLKESSDVGPDEALREAIRDCSTIISCVGAVRRTNLWTDFLARPLWRLLRSDVRGWCSDARHPFYTHFHSTRKVLDLAEREQMRREAAAAYDNEDNDCSGADKEKRIVSRIRFIRISDLCVAQAPWNFVPVLTNILHSMVFRYQDMAERVLESSSLIETVILRPGDLVDEERDVTTTSLQVDPSGYVPCPARVGREDVAALAVASALFDSQPRQKQKRRTGDRSGSNDDGLHIGDTDDDYSNDEPFHYTLACRWASDQLDPYPAQGQMSEGLPTANLCLQAALRTLRGQRPLRAAIAAKRNQAGPESVLRRHVKATPQRRRIKPYGICVAVPVYLVLSLMLRSLLYYAATYLPGLQHVKPIARQVMDAFVVTVAFVVGRLSVLFRGNNSVPLLRKWIPRRYSTNYISL
jgi:hypothetical protein